MCVCVCVCECVCRQCTGLHAACSLKYTDYDVLLNVFVDKCNDFDVCVTVHHI